MCHITKVSIAVQPYNVQLCTKLITIVSRKCAHPLLLALLPVMHLWGMKLHVILHQTYFCRRTQHYSQQHNAQHTMPFRVLCPIRTWLWLLAAPLCIIICFKDTEHMIWVLNMKHLKEHPPPQISFVRCSTHGYSFVRLQYYLILYTFTTTCRLCTWRCRSHQLDSNIWRNLSRIQKCSTHFHSTITFSKCVGSLVKSNNSHYIKYMKVGRTMTL